jgi:lipoprotein-releasing system ATP-binding protein
MLIATNITKKYGTLEVLKGVSCSLEKGEIVSIIGSSGAGKSTLLHIIGTLDQADGGEVIINGNSIKGLSGKKLSTLRNQNLGFIFQFHHLLPEFSALENVCIPAWLAGTNKKDTQQHAETLLKKVGLADRIHHKPSELSGGEQQRVAIARALINKPALVLADEPTGNLDSKNSEEVFALIKRLRDEYGHAFLIVTHNTELAVSSDRIIKMADGRIVD